MASMEGASKLFDENRGLAIHAVYSKYSRFSQINIEDLLQEAYLALWQAALAYDESRGVKFSSYALPYIIAAVATAARDSVNNSVYYPKSIKTLASKLLKHYGSLEAITQSHSVYDEFAQYKKSSIDGAIQFLKGPISLSTVTGDGDEFNLLDVYCDPDAASEFEEIEIASLISDIKARLTREESFILDLLLEDDKAELSTIPESKIVRTRHKVLKLYLLLTGKEQE